MQHIIDYIRSDSSKNFKVSALAEHKNNELFKELLSRTYSPLVRFGISLAQIPEYTLTGNCMGLEKALVEMDKLSNREITGNAAKAHVAEVLSNLSEENAEIIKLMLDGSLKLGCNVSSINKGIGRNFVKETPYQGAESYSTEAAESLFANEEVLALQMKMDGRYSNKAIEGGKVSIESRQGLPNFFGDSFNPFSVFEELYGEPIVLNGELLVRGVPDRYEANGMVSSIDSIGAKLLLGEDVEKELKKFEKRFGCSYYDKLNDLYFVVWDFIPMWVYTSQDHWDEPYEERLVALEKMIATAGLPNIELVETHFVRSMAEAEKIAATWIKNGFEGGILKSLKSGWKKGKKKHQIKYKLEMDFDLLLVDGNWGNKGTKNEGLISSLQVQTSCGQLVTNPGGLKEDDMAYFTANLDALKGDAVIKVKCCGLSQDKHGVWSLLHPVFQEVRTDKAVADSLEDCQKAQASFIEMKAMVSVSEPTLPPQVKSADPLGQTSLF